MGAWGTGVFENDTALDTIAEMSGLIDNYYTNLIESDNAYNVVLAGFIYAAVKDKDKAIELFADPDIDLLNEIEIVLRGLTPETVKDSKYNLIGRLYKCLDHTKYWKEDCRADRKKTIQEMIDFIVKED